MSLAPPRRSAARVCQAPTPSRAPSPPLPLPHQPVNQSHLLFSPPVLFSPQRLRSLLFLTCKRVRERRYVCVCVSGCMRVHEALQRATSVSPLFLLFSCVCCTCRTRLTRTSSLLCTPAGVRDAVRRRAEKGEKGVVDASPLARLLQRSSLSLHLVSHDDSVVCSCGLQVLYPV